MIYAANDMYIPDSVDVKQNLKIYVKMPNYCSSVSTVMHIGVSCYKYGLN